MTLAKRLRLDTTDVDTNSSQVKHVHVEQEVFDKENHEASEGVHEAQETKGFMPKLVRVLQESR